MLKVTGYSREVYWKCMLNFVTKNKIVELKLELVNGDKIVMKGI